MDDVFSLQTALTAPGERDLHKLYDDTYMLMSHSNFVFAGSEVVYGEHITSYYNQWQVNND